MVVTWRGAGIGDRLFRRCGLSSSGIIVVPVVI